MSTKKNCGHSKPCGCEDTPLTTNPPCGDGPECNDPNPCPEVFNANCIYYTGEPILCETDEVVTSNMSLADAIAAVIAYFCNTAEHELPSQLECVIPGEVPVTEVVSPAGSTLDETLQNIVAYFCGKINDISIDIDQINIDIANLQSIDHSSFVIASTLSEGTAISPNGCVTRTYSYQLFSGAGPVGDPLAFNITNCPTDAICDDAAGIAGPPPDTARVLMCNAGDPILVNVDEFALTDDIPVVPLSNAYGLFSQTNNSHNVTDTNPTGTMFGPGEGSLTIDPLQYQFQRGDSFKLDGSGHITANSPTASTNLEIRVFINAVEEILLVVPVNAITDLHWSLEMNFTVRTVNVGLTPGSVMTSLKFINQEDGGNDIPKAHMATNLSSLDTAAVNTLDITATWVNPTAGNDFYSEIMNLHKIY